MNEPTPLLLERFGEGELRGYEVLYERYRLPLSRFIDLRVDDSLRREVSAEDVLQETHAKALAHLDGFIYRRELSFYFWLCMIARNIIRMHYRQLKQRPAKLTRARGIVGAHSSRDLLDAIQDRGPTPLDWVQMRENLHVLAIALGEIGSRRRHAVILRFFEDCTSDEGACRMNLQSGAFRVLVSRGLADLRRNLQVLLGEAAAMEP